MMIKNIADFRERAEASAQAKRFLLDRVKAKLAADSPGLPARQEQRRARSEAREARRAARQDEKAAIAAAEAAELEVAEMARQEERKRQRAELEKAAADDVLLKAKQKAARDARYAKRKARR